MMRILCAAGIAVTIALGLAACSGSKKNGNTPYGAGDPSLGASSPAGSVSPFLTDGQAVMQALDAIAARSGQPLRITMLNANAAGGMTVDVQQSAKHDRLDRYQVTLNGTIFGPIPENLLSAGGVPATAAEIERRAFDPKSLALARLAQAEREAIARSKFSDARVSQWDFGGLKPDDRRDMVLEANRGRVIVVLDPGLKIVRMRF